MVDQVLTLTYTTTGRRQVLQSGLTSPMGDAMRRFLTRNATDNFTLVLTAA